MPKTENLQNLLRELTRTRNFEPKMLEQKVFRLWHQRLGTPFNTKTAPVSLSNGVLKIYTQYPPLKNELLLLKERVIADLNAELGKTVLTDIKIEIRQSSNATHHDTKQTPTTRKKTPEKISEIRAAAPTTETLEQIEQTIADVTDTQLKTALQQLFVTQSTDKS